MEEGRKRPDRTRPHIVKSVIWGPEGGEIRPSLEVSGNRLFSGQSSGQGIGTGNAEVYVFEKK